MAALIVPINDYSPVYQGDTGNAFIIQVLHLNGYLSILGATITMVMQSVSDPTIFHTCDPTKWTIDSLDNGRASYAYQTADVAIADSWKMWIKIVLSSGRVVHVDDGKGSPIILVVLPLPSGV